MHRIRELREEKGLTQVRLAVAADMNPATLNRIEMGKANPNLKTLERLADALGITVSRLLEDDSPKRGAVGLGPDVADYVQAAGLDPDPALTDVPLPNAAVTEAHEAALIRLLKSEQGDLFDPELHSYVLALAKVVAGLPDGADKAALQRCAKTMMGRSIVRLQAEMARTLGGTTAAA